jgi:acetoin utilization deacetylase AcuC-like enzyme
MKCCYHPGYHVPLPSGHPFPKSKYLLLKNRLLAEGLLTEGDILTPQPVDRATIELIHCPRYVDQLESGCLSVQEERRLGLPWSPALWERSRLAAGGTLRTARAALETGMAANLAGGTHHAFADHGEGFCLLNDIAIAIARLRAEHAVGRVLVIDLDVHQGNGTAAIFAGDRQVFTFSMHAQHNYPAEKMRSTLDLGLANGVGDVEYLAALAHHLPAALDAGRSDLAFYLAGVDVASGDRFGKLALTDEGIRARDRYVIETLRGRGIPLAVVLGGGYAPTAERTAELHCHVFREAVDYERRVRRPRMIIP